MNIKKINSMLKEHIDKKTLTDAHRHSLYDLNKINGLKNLSVNEWSDSFEFTSYQKRTKKIYGNQLLYEIKDWLNFSIEEGVTSILDFSAKHARDDLKNIYSQHGIKSFSPLKWKTISRIENKDSIPEFIILPDERWLTTDILIKAIEFANRFPKIRFTMHCLESKEQNKIAQIKFGMSTIEWLKKHNFLNNRLLLVHLNEASSKDISLIRESGTEIVLCSLMRKPLQYKTPNIPLDIPIYFGTDAPLISGNRSLLDVAIQQVEDWINIGLDLEYAVTIAAKGLTRKLSTNEDKKK